MRVVINKILVFLAEFECCMGVSLFLSVGGEESFFKK